MPEKHLPIAVRLREAAERMRASEASLCAKCGKTCPKVSAVIAKYADEYAAVQDELEALRKRIPKPKLNLLGAGRKPKITPRIIKCVLKLREDGLSFGEIAEAINGVSPVKISRSSAYEIYEKYGKSKEMTESS
jgi:hypothetical protein